MGRYFARELIKRMIHTGCSINRSRVLILGITFKENVPDIRNSKVVDIIKELREFGVTVDVWDPIAIPEEVKHEYGIDLVQQPLSGPYDGVILAVKHEGILESLTSAPAYMAPKGIFYDIKEALRK